LSRLSDPFWFQSFGAVIGMDWNSSGVTTTVMSALKKSLNPHSKELGIYVCGGKGKQSLKTPQELIQVGERTGLDGYDLARSSKLSTKVDNTAIQDGFQLYFHSFVVSNQGDWSVIQQAIQTQNSTARRYHWHSADVKSFVSEPHSAICGENLGDILNLVDIKAQPTQQSVLNIAGEHPDKILKEVRHLVMSTYKGIQAKDIDLKRLGSILWLAQESQHTNFEEILLLKGLGPRILQSLALVSEVIHSTPSRFTDPARFSFAHGGKCRGPFPILTKVYDETIETLKSSVERVKMGQSDKNEAIKKLSDLAQRAEQDFVAHDNLEQLIEKENKEAWRYGGRTTKGFSKKPKNGQIGLFG
jgi:hypothetical protein